MQEEENKKSLKSKARERMNPKLKKMEINYEKL